MADIAHRIIVFCVALPSLLMSGCMSAGEHRSAVSTNTNDRLTIGTVQREIRVGMSSADVVNALGSPNMVTTDELRREQWVYDRVATERVYSTSHGGVSALVLGGVTGAAAALGAGVAPAFEHSAGASTTSQRTLTIIVKFDATHRVRDFAYRTSSF